MNDQDFLRNKVPMTKAEVRAISLDKLALTNKRTLLDIGAGTGSVSLQAALEHPQLQVTAIEHDPDALDIMRQNMTHLQTPPIELIAGWAPADLPQRQFDAIFVGGSGQQLPEICQFAQDWLTPGGSLVLNFILLENAQTAAAALRRAGFADVEGIEVRVSHWHALGKGHYFKPQNPTIILSTRKER